MNEEKKFFTMEEAEKLLPWLTVRLRKVLERKQAIEYLVSEHREFARMIEVTNDDGFQFLLGHNVEVSKTFHRACLQFYELLQEIINKGIIVKDLDQGLIDFPHRFQGREIYLCWKLGEKGLLYWHERDAGFQGRQLIVNLDRVYRKR